MKWCSERPVLGGLIAGATAVYLAMLFNIGFTHWASGGHSLFFIADQLLIGLILVPFGWFYMWMFFRKPRQTRGD